MKRICILLFVITLGQSGFSQKEGDVTRWELKRTEFVSGDTIQLTLIIGRKNETYYYTDPAWYKLYRIENGKHVPMEDTTKKGAGPPVILKRKDKVVIKKVIRQPGLYVLRYPVHPGQVALSPFFGEQTFLINRKTKDEKAQ